MANKREWAEGKLPQGVDEEITYTVDVTNWGNTPSSPSLVVKDQEGKDVTSAVTTGTASVNGNVITLPKIKSLEAGVTYRVEVKFTISGNVLEVYGFIEGEE